MQTVCLTGATGTGMEALVETQNLAGVTETGPKVPVSEVDERVTGELAALRGRLDQNERRHKTRLEELANLRKQEAAQHEKLQKELAENLAALEQERAERSEAQKRTQEQVNRGVPPDQSGSGTTGNENGNVTTVQSHLDQGRTPGQAGAGTGNVASTGSERTAAQTSEHLTDDQLEHEEQVMAFRRFCGTNLNAFTINKIMDPTILDGLERMTSDGYDAHLKSLEYRPLVMTGPDPVEFESCWHKFQYQDAETVAMKFFDLAYMQVNHMENFIADAVSLRHRYVTARKHEVLRTITKHYVQICDHILTRGQFLTDKIKSVQGFDFPGTRDLLPKDVLARTQNLLCGVVENFGILEVASAEDIREYEKNFSIDAEPTRLGDIGTGDQTVQRTSSPAQAARRSDQGGVAGSDTCTNDLGVSDKVMSILNEKRMNDDARMGLGLGVKKTRFGKITGKMFDDDGAEESFGDAFGDTFNVKTPLASSTGTNAKSILTSNRTGSERSRVNQLEVSCAKILDDQTPFSSLFDASGLGAGLGGLAFRDRWQPSVIEKERAYLQLPAPFNRMPSKVETRLTLEPLKSGLPNNAKFDGTVAGWKKFEAAYNSSIHRVQADEEAKLRALDKSIDKKSSDQAWLASLFSATDWSPASYFEILGQLVKRYGGKDRLSQALFDELNALKQVNDNDYDGLSAFLSLLRNYGVAEESRGDHGAVLSKPLYRCVMTLFKPTAIRSFTDWATNKDIPVNIRSFVVWCDARAKSLWEAKLLMGENDTSAKAKASSSTSTPKSATEQKKTWGPPWRKNAQSVNAIATDASSTGSQSSRSGTGKASSAPTTWPENVAHLSTSKGKSDQSGQNSVRPDSGGQKSKTPEKCPACKGPFHDVTRCKSYLKLAVQERREMLGAGGCCFCCGKHGHMSSSCPTTVGKGCSNCSSDRHTTTLCTRDSKKDTVNAIIDSTDVGPVIGGSDSSIDLDEFIGMIEAEEAALTKRRVLVKRTSSLRIVAIRIRNPRTRKTTVVNALLDTGATGIYLSKRAARDLTLRGEEKFVQVGTIHGQKQERCVLADVILESLTTKFKAQVPCLVMNQLLKSMKVVDWNVEKHNFEHLKDLEFAPICEDRGDQIDAIIGVNYPGLNAALQKDVVGKKLDDPVAQLGVFGMTAIGRPLGEIPEPAEGEEDYFNFIDSLDGRCEFLDHTPKWLMVDGNGDFVTDDENEETVALIQVETAKVLGTTVGQTAAFDSAGFPHSGKSRRKFRRKARRKAAHEGKPTGASHEGNPQEGKAEQHQVLAVTEKKSRKYDEDGLRTEFDFTAFPVDPNIERQTSEQILVELLKRQWETEKPLDVGPLTIEQQYAQSLLEKVRRWDESEQKWILPVLWKKGEPQLPNNRYAAVQELSWLDKGPLKDPELRKTYHEVFASYLEQKMIEEVPATDGTDGNLRFASHFPVVKPERLTTKVRPVFNYAKKFKGKSLNDAVMAGPNLLCDIRQVIIRARRNPVFVLLDISKMFLNILMPESDRGYHRFLWRETPESAIKEYQFRRHPFGNKGSPAVAVFCIKKLAEEQATCFPRAAESMLDSTLMDDVVDSYRTPEEAIEVIQHLLHMYGLCGMQVGKIATSSEEVWDSVPDQKRIPTIEIKDVSEGNDVIPNIKTLGLYIIGGEDMFAFTPLRVDIHLKWTKRTVLKVYAKVYDPVGFIAPVLMVAKAIFQACWIAKLDWDTPLEGELLEKWMKWLTSLKALVEIRVPRAIRSQENWDKNVKHVFADASEVAFGYTCFLRTLYEDNSVDVSLVLANARLAPLEARTIPRLELMAATHSLDSLKLVNGVYKLPPEDIHWYSDSATTLAWIHAESREYKIFVAQRASRIQRNTLVSNWHHVPTDHNPADIVSRGKYPSDLAGNDLWWRGPGFLGQEPVVWPEMPENVLERKEKNWNDSDESAAEKKARVGSSALVPQVCLASTAEIVKTWRKFGVSYGDVERKFELAPEEHTSDLQKLVWQTALWKRVVRKLVERRWCRGTPKVCTVSGYRRKMEAAEPLRCRPALDSVYQFVTPSERQEALDFLIRQHQRENFADEIKDLSEKGQVKVNSKIACLTPWIDQNGILRVSSRLAGVRAMSAEERHPVIIKPDTPLGKALAWDAHERLNKHGGGYKDCLSRLNCRYVMVKGAYFVKRFLRKCVTCRKINATPTTQIMARLPDFRTNEGKERLPPFSTAAIDVFGPFYSSHGRGQPRTKVWVLLICCAQYRCVGLEPLYDMSTEAFTAALNTFLTRRPVPKRIVTDNGTNLVGLGNTLQKVYSGETISPAKVVANFPSIEWQFIPAAASHMAGVHERLVQSAKRAISKILSSTRLTPSEMRSVCNFAETSLNNRPISFMSADNRDVRPLTPNHFLMQSEAAYVGPFQETKYLWKNRYQEMKKILDTYWRCFLKEVLPQFHVTPKWRREKPPIEEGQIVVVLDPELKRCEWPLGRVERVHISRDGFVRSATIWVKGKLQIIPITKLAVIPVYESVTDTDKADKDLKLAPTVAAAAAAAGSQAVTPAEQ